jgi:hypothetical protein
VRELLNIINMLVSFSPAFLISFKKLTVKEQNSVAGELLGVLLCSDGQTRTELSHFEETALLSNKDLRLFLDTTDNELRIELLFSAEEKRTYVRRIARIPKRRGVPRRTQSELKALVEILKRMRP